MSLWTWRPVSCSSREARPTSPRLPSSSRTIWRARSSACSASSSSSTDSARARERRSLTDSCSRPTCAAMLAPTWRDCPASWRTSCATTAKPVPRSPARVASTEALSASIWVERAIDCTSRASRPSSPTGAARASSVVSVSSRSRSAARLLCSSASISGWCCSSSRSLVPGSSRVTPALAPSVVSSCWLMLAKRSTSSLLLCSDCVRAASMLRFQTGSTWRGSRMGTDCGPLSTAIDSGGLAEPPGRPLPVPARMASSAAAKASAAQVAAGQGESAAPALPAATSRAAAAARRRAELRAAGATGALIVEVSDIPVPWKCSGLRAEGAARLVAAQCPHSPRPRRPDKPRRPGAVLSVRARGRGHSAGRRGHPGATGASASRGPGR